MSALSELAPKERQRVIDLVKAAGVDVSDWANCQGGEARAAANPRYCYDWSFIEPKKVVVLNLWHEAMEERSGSIVMPKINMREFASVSEGPVKKRALKFDDAIRTAFQDNLPIRVIVCDGWRRPADDPTTASQVSKRLLDPLMWVITAYNRATGECDLARGLHPNCFVDQFSFPDGQSELPERRDFSGQRFARDAQVRSNVRVRAKGKCDWCGERGFIMADGRIFIETHHVVSLGESGLDTESNVVALCPNHHREAHHGANRDKMRKALLEQLRSLPSSSRC